MVTLNRHERDDRILTELWKGEGVSQINYVQVTPEGQHCLTHVHHDTTETFIGLKGVIYVYVNDEMVDISEGSVTVKPGTRHSLVASAGAAYLELRSTVYDPASPDKHFVYTQDYNPLVGVKA